MAPTPSQKCINPNFQTPQSKQRLNFSNPKGCTQSHLSLNPVSVTPTEHPVEVIGRIRDHPNRKDKSSSSSSSALEITADRLSVRVRSDVGYKDFSLDGISLSENEDLEGFYKRFVATRVEGVRSGAKCTIMMYGPTGAGKSHTMFGCTKESGIVYMALKDILGEGDRDAGVDDVGFGITLFVQVAVLEIYNEEIYDLLSGWNGIGAGSSGIASKGSTPKTRLEVMGRKAKNATYIYGSEAGKISREVAKVEKRRIVKSTLLNERSSRSHCVIILDVPSVGGKLMLVDMAGSENIEHAGQVGFEAKIQTAKINQGNIALKRVVESIANGDSHVPFRDSKLTLLLQDSFEDNKSKILMILCASPDPKEMHKTIATLEYGAKAKCIVRAAHMSTPRDKLSSENSSTLLRSRIVAMNRLIYNIQMENKVKDKEFNKVQRELLHKDEEIIRLQSKLELIEVKGAAAKEEEIECLVSDRTWALRNELKEMEEKMHQQQKELYFLRKQLEGVEATKLAANEYALHLQGRDSVHYLKLMVETCIEDQGMERSMELDIGDQQPIHDVLEIMDNDSKNSIVLNSIQQNLYNSNSVLRHTLSGPDQQPIHDVLEIMENDSKNSIALNSIQQNLYNSNIEEDVGFDRHELPDKLCLSTVFERDDEGEDKESMEEDVDKDKESMEEEVDKEVVQVIGDNFAFLSKNENEDPDTLPDVDNANDSESMRRTRIQNIFRLCGNHRELAQQSTVPIIMKRRLEDASISSSPLSQYKELASRENHSVESLLHSKPCEYSISTQREAESEQESKVNKESIGIDAANLMNIFVKWESSKECSGIIITKLLVLRNCTLGDLRKLIESHLAEVNNDRPFIFLLEPFGAPVPKEKESAIFVNKLPTYNNQLNSRLACLRSTKNSVQWRNQFPFTSLENTLPRH